MSVTIIKKAEIECNARRERFQNANKMLVDLPGE